MNRFNFFNKGKDRDKKENSKEEKIQAKVEDLEEVFAEVKEENKIQMQEEKKDNEEAVKIAKREAIKHTAQEALKILESHPDMSAMDFFKTIYKSEDLPNDVMTEIIMKLLDNNKENMAVKAVEAIDLPSQAVAYIARENPDLSYEASQRIVEQIKDEELQDEETKRIRHEQENSILRELKEIEKSCTSIEMNELVEKLKGVEMPFVTDRIQNEINHIIAKVTAFNCMKFGGPRLEDMFQFFPAEDMLEENFTQMVKKEYEIMKKDFEEKNISFENLGRSVTNQCSVKYKEYKPEYVKNMILQRIARNTAERQERHAMGMEGLTNLLNKLPSQKKESYVKEFIEQINAGKIKNREETELSKAVTKLLLEVDELSTPEAIRVVNSMTGVLKERREARQLINGKKIENSSHESNDNSEIDRD